MTPADGPRDAISIPAPGWTAPAGLVFRHFRGAGDYPGLAAANQAARDQAGLLDFVDVDTMARDYAHLVNCDLAHDMLVVEHDGVIVGYARTDWRDQTDGERALNVVCLLQPSMRRRRIGSAMLAWAEAHLLEVAARLPADRPMRMRSWTLDADAGAAVLLAARGWARTGRGYEMVRPTLDGIPDTALPGGFEVRPVTLADSRSVWDAEVEAFRDHRAEPETVDEDWRGVLADPHRDPTLWAIAFRGDMAAAGVQGRIDPAENAHHGVLRGYIDSVWTRRDHRRRGLARALLARVLVLLRERGMTSAYLGVDGLNPNQAITLYESLGFQVRTSNTDWAKPLPAAAGGGEDHPKEDDR